MIAKQMKNILCLMLVFASLTGRGFQVNAQHKIDITMPVFAGDTLIFGHYFRETLMIKDSAVLTQRVRGFLKGMISCREDYILFTCRIKPVLTLLLTRTSFFLSQLIQLIS